MNGQIEGEEDGPGGYLVGPADETADAPKQEELGPEIEVAEWALPQDELSRSRRKQMRKVLLELIAQSSPEPLPFSDQGLSQPVRKYLAAVMKEQQREGKETYYTEQECGMSE